MLFTRHVPPSYRKRAKHSSNYWLAIDRRRVRLMILQVRVRLSARFIVVYQASTCPRDSDHFAIIVSFAKDRKTQSDITLIATRMHREQESDISQKLRMRRVAKHFFR